jgi:hypothetical protein
VSTIHAGGVRFRLYPQDHEPVHAHGRYGETIAIVELHSDRTVSLMRWPDLPANAKHGDVRKILAAAAEHFDAIIDAWEKMH